MIPDRRDLTILSKAVPFYQEWGFLNGGLPMDFTGASARMQIRRYPGAPDALVSLMTVTSAVQGLRFFKLRDDAILDGLRITIAGTTIASLPGLALLKTGESKAFSYDLLISLASRPESVWLYGELLVAPGVTRT